MRREVWFHRFASIFSPVAKAVRAAPTLPDTVGVVKMFRKGQSHATMSFCICSEQCCHHSRNGPLSTRRGADILVRNSPTYQRRHLPPPQTYTCLMPKVGGQFEYRGGFEGVDKFSTPPTTNTHPQVPALDAGPIHCQRQRTAQPPYGPRIKCGD